MIVFYTSQLIPHSSLLTPPLNVRVKMWCCTMVCPLHLSLWNVWAAIMISDILTFWHSDILTILWRRLYSGRNNPTSKAAAAQQPAAVERKVRNTNSGWVWLNIRVPLTASLRCEQDSGWSFKFNIQSVVSPSCGAGCWIILDYDISLDLFPVLMFWRKCLHTNSHIIIFCIQILHPDSHDLRRF